MESGMGCSSGGALFEERKQNWRRKPQVRLASDGKQRTPRLGLGPFLKQKKRERSGEWDLERAESVERAVKRRCQHLPHDHQPQGDTASLTLTLIDMNWLKTKER